MSARHTLAIPADVQAVLRESTIGADRVVLPARQLERKLYAGVIKVLGEYGGKWSKPAGAILIKASDREKLEAALSSGTVQRTKVIRQAFLTPPEVARRFAAFISDVVPAAEAITLLEPSAGEGALVAAVRAEFNARETVVGITCVEIDEGACQILRERACGRILHADFLRLRPEDLGTFTVIAQNAPYQKGQALKHFEHALKFLAPGGVLAAIVPQNFVAPVEVDSEDIEAGAFKESGTNIATKMIRYVRGAA